MPTEKITISKLTLSDDVRPREKLNPKTVKDYKAMYAEAAEENKPPPLPEPKVFRDGRGQLWVSSGFHRVTAAIEAGLKELDCDVHEGGKRDAILDAMSHNNKDGERKTAADRAMCVNRLLNDSSWREMSVSEIARATGASRRSVQRMIDRRKAKTDKELAKADEPAKPKTPTNGKGCAVRTPSLLSGFEDPKDASPSAATACSNSTIEKEGNKVKVEIELERIAPELHEYIKKLNPPAEDVHKLTLLEEADQVAAMQLLKDDKVNTIPNAIKAQENMPIRKGGKPASVKKAVEWLGGMKKSCDEQVVGIDKLLQEVKVPSPNHAEEARKGLDMARRAFAQWAKCVKARDN